jgi:quinol monooxygenase YgiN
MARTEPCRLISVFGGRQVAIGRVEGREEMSGPKTQPIRRLIRRLTIPFCLLCSLVIAVPGSGREAKEAPMVMTVLEARVPAARLSDVERVFREGMSPLPADIVESYLVRDTKDPSSFRLTTVWRSMAALQAMRQSGVKPKGVQMFEAVGATPSLSVFEVVVHSQH